MNIEIKGVNFINKGAELMLYSIMQEFEDRSIGAEFCMNIKDVKLAPDSLMKINLYPWRYSKKIPFLGPLLNASFRFFGIKNFQGRKVVTRNNIDVVLDASGFVYSDQWGSGSAEVMAVYFKKARKLGQKVVLLPQALGPFENKVLRNSMKHLVKYSDLVFARDDISFSSIKEIVPNTENIFQCPDFTIKIKGNEPEYLSNYKNKVCIIPNYRMIDMIDDGNYLNYLNNLIKSLKKSGLDFYFLIHESNKDKSLVEDLQQMNSEKYSILFEEDPLKIKKVIGTARFVVASRFHGIVSSITQGIPTIATGWSHKYEMLFKEYSISEYFISDLTNNQGIENAIDKFCNEEDYQMVKEKLNNRNGEVLNLVNQMWDKVFKLIS